MRLLTRPTVFVGPSLARWRVEQLLPGCVVRPPIERGDLYRDRLLGGSAFLILDGVSPQQSSVSVQEIEDVMADNALVVGAASLGALRAAECWASGMQGIGLTYRALRSGAVLLSDDEIATAADVDSEFGARGGWSVSLFNVRFATSRLRRRGLIDARQRERIVAAAEALFFTERRWETILAAAGCGHQPQLAQALSGINVAAADAEQALSHLQRRLSPDSSDRTLTQWSHRSAGPGRPLAAVVPDESRRTLLSWLLVSGRCHRYLRCAPTRSGQTRQAAPPGRAQADMQRFLANLEVFDETDQAEEDRWLARMGLGAPDPLAGETPRWQDGLMNALSELGRTGERLWTELVRAGELDSELSELAGLRAAVLEARDRGLSPSDAHRGIAEQTIARDHRCRAWQDLAERTPADGELWPRLCAYRDELALACAARDVEADVSAKADTRATTTRD